MGPILHSVAALSAALLAPIAVPALIARPSWRRGLSQRLGRVPKLEPGSIWIHGSSVGEALAAARLLAALRAEGRSVFGSLSTISGRDTLRRVLPEVPCSLVPVDHPWCVERALARVRPDALVLVETELWPSLVAAARRRGTPVALVSGRISDRSLRRYRRFGPWIAPTLRRLDCVGARSERDAERFVALGAPSERVRVTGDLKLDPPAPAPALAPDLAAALTGTAIFVAGSTHAGEESAALDALAACERSGQRAILVLAPRHLQRLDLVEREVRAAGRVVHRRSSLSGGALASGEVLLLDTLGELASVYSTAALAFVGGTLAPVGGHNLLEPIQAGCPVCFGPELSNVRPAAALLTRSGAGRCVSGREDLARVVAEGLADPQPRRRARAGRRALEAHRGSVERSLEMVREVVPGMASARASLVASVTAP